MAKKLTKKQQAYKDEQQRIATKVASITLKKHDVFYSEDKTGDFANVMFFFNGNTRNFQNEIYYQCLTLEGDSDYYTLAELNPNISTIRQYNPDTDGDFYGATGC
jgi:hypothetical protein